MSSTGINTSLVPSDCVHQWNHHKPGTFWLCPPLASTQAWYLLLIMYTTGINTSLVPSDYVFHWHQHKPDSFTSMRISVNRLLSYICHPHRMTTNITPFTLQKKQALILACIRTEFKINLKTWTMVFFTAFNNKQMKWTTQHQLWWHYRNTFHHLE